MNPGHSQWITSLALPYTLLFLRWGLPRSLCCSGRFIHSIVPCLSFRVQNYRCVTSCPALNHLEYSVWDMASHYACMFQFLSTSWLIIMICYYDWNKKHLGISEAHFWVLLGRLWRCDLGHNIWLFSSGTVLWSAFWTP